MLAIGIDLNVFELRPDWSTVELSSRTFNRSDGATPPLAAALWRPRRPTRVMALPGRRMCCLAALARSMWRSRSRANGASPPRRGAGLGRRLRRCVGGGDRVRLRKTMAGCRKHLPAGRAPLT